MKKAIMNHDITILVVDDEPAIITLIASVLGTVGYKLVTVSNCAQCLKITRQMKPDLIMMDVNLPDGNGAELCRKIKADPDTKGTFIVLMSGTEISSQAQTSGLDLGADGYIVKSISNRELLARMNAMVRIIRAEQERDRLIIELEEALANVKTLKGLLPICSFCKKIRDDTGHWNNIEDYIARHSEAGFSHGFCEECMEKHYPDSVDDED